MVKYATAIIVILLIACIIQNPQLVDTGAYPPLFPEIAVVTKDSVKQEAATLAYSAVDRQCGSCHHGDRSTNAGALAIFNLQNACWYCPLTPEQCESLKGRISGSSFTDAEREAIVAVIAHLSSGNDGTTH